MQNVQRVENDGRTLSTQDWIDVAKATLIREGIEAVKIDRLARACGVTRGGFYWRFKSRRELLDTLLADWRLTNTAPILAVLRGSGAPETRFARLAQLWIEEREFSPDYDAAVRHWSMSDPVAAKIVHLVEDERIDALRSLFVEMGFEQDEALVRARVTYYHQVGYYTLEVKDTPDQRRKLLPLYMKVLLGG